jgi:hypothetical protein
MIICSENPRCPLQNSGWWEKIWQHRPEAQRCSTPDKLERGVLLRERDPETRVKTLSNGEKPTVGMHRILILVGFWTFLAVAMLDVISQFFDLFSLQGILFFIIESSLIRKFSAPSFRTI